jgi:pimeloyl-ACP methyl ester carboxylesterase
VAKVSVHVTASKPVANFERVKKEQPLAAAAGTVPLGGIVGRNAAGYFVNADDTAALLDALGLPSAHVCGASMGGMVAQHLAVRHPQRVRSLTLMMTTSGARRLPQPTLRVRAALIARPARFDIDALVAHYVHLLHVIGSPGFPPDEGELRERLEFSIRRSFRPRAVARQIAAIAADGDRSALLARVAAPTAILHGAADPLIPVAAAHDLAAKIAGASVEVIDGWGHDLPRELWPRQAEVIAAVAARQPLNGRR